QRGRSIFSNHCSECHMDDLSGRESAPPLAGDAFLRAWQGRTLADLFDRIRNTMPQNAPGSLGRKEYIDLVSFLLSANDLPPGKEELQDDPAALKQIVIKKK